MTSTISYSRTGSGEPVVLIHGIGHRREAWGQVPQLLSREYDVIAVDLPGHGLSPAPERPAGYAMPSYVQQMEEFFEDLDLGRPHVAGNSLGGILALELAARGSVRTCAALSPAGFWAKYELALLGANLVSLKATAHAPEAVVRAVLANPRLKALSLRSLYAHPENVPFDVAVGDTRNLRASRGFWPCFARGLALSYKPTPVVPTTVAWGDKDRLLPPHQARRAEGRLPGVHHVSLPDCGHVPMVDHPDLVARVIADTVARAGERALNGLSTSGD